MNKFIFCSVIETKIGLRSLFVKFNYKRKVQLNLLYFTNILFWRRGNKIVFLIKKPTVYLTFVAIVTKVEKTGNRIQSPANQKSRKPLRT